MRTLIAFGICLFSISALTLHGTSENSQQEVKDLWAKMLEAKGVTLSPVRTFVVSLKATNSSAFKNDNAGIERRRIVSSLPAGWWIFNDFRPGKLGASISVSDLTSQKAWIRYVSNGDAPQSANPDTPGERQSRELILAALFCQATGFTPKLIEARHLVREGVHTYDVVTVSWNDKLVYYLDPSTHLPAKLEIVIKGKTIVPAYGERPAKTISYTDSTPIVMEDYRSVHGIRMPSRIKIKDSWYDVSAKINVALPPDLFRKPPIGVNSEDDWQRQNE